MIGPVHPSTARFVLAIAALLLASGALVGLLMINVSSSNEKALFLALGFILGLPGVAFGFYFGDKASNTSAADRSTNDDA